MENFNDFKVKNWYSRGQIVISVENNRIYEIANCIEAELDEMVW